MSLSCGADASVPAGVATYAVLTDRRRRAPQVLSGLAAAGYTLLAAGTCASIQGPTIRSAIQSYVTQRGLSLVFAPRDGSRQEACALIPALHTPTFDAASSQYRRDHQADQRHVGGVWAARSGAKAARRAATPRRSRRRAGWAAGTTRARCCPRPRRCPSWGIFHDLVMTYIITP